MANKSDSNSNRIETHIIAEGSTVEAATGQLKLPYDTPDSINSGGNSINSGENSINSGENSSELEVEGELNPVDILRSAIPDATWEKLLQIGEPARKGRVASSSLAHLIFNLCSEHSLTIQQLGFLLNRKPVGLRSNYVSQMVDQGLLILIYPDKINHPRQAYRAA